MEDIQIENSSVNPAWGVYNNVPPYQERISQVVVENKRNYTGLESVFAWVCLAFGYFFCKVFPAHQNPLGAFLLVVAIFSATTVVLKVKKVKLGVMPVVVSVSAVVVCGLLSYDRDFSRMIGNMIDLDAGKVFSNIWCLCLGIIVGQYVFRLFVAAADNAVKDKCTEDECVAKLKSMQKAHVATALAAVLPILFIYVVYFISQWKYYMSAFTGKLPVGLSYADYAREGFFQLCAVSVINMIIIVFVQMFMDVSKSAIAKVKSGIVITYAVFTLVLIATAISKMILYIDTYGLTEKRVLSSWLMLVLSVIFVVVIVKQFVSKLNAVAVSVAVVVVAFGILALSNVDGIIARYNVDRYLDGSLETVDVWALQDLGDAAVPELVRLMEELEDRGEVGTDAHASSIYDRTKGVLEDIALEYDNEDRQIMSYTIPYIKAKDALKEAGIESVYYEW